MLCCSTCTVQVGNSKLNKNIQLLDSFKVIIVGGAKVGKTAVFQRFLRNEFPSQCNTLETGG